MYEVLRSIENVIITWKDKVHPLLSNDFGITFEGGSRGQPLPFLMTCIIIIIHHDGRRLASYTIFVLP